MSSFWLTVILFLVIYLKFLFWDNFSVGLKPRILTELTSLASIIVYPSIIIFLLLANISSLGVVIFGFVSLLFLPIVRGVNPKAFRRLALFTFPVMVLFTVTPLLIIAEFLAVLFFLFLILWFLGELLSSNYDQ